LKQELNNRIPIVGVGGIDSLSAAREKIAAGSTLLQLYSGLIYQGPELVKILVRNI
jgi:dihydroorotate dehydrogenase